MQAPDDVEFRYRFGPALASDPKGLLKGHSVSGGRVGLAAEGAEPATGHAHIRRVEVPVDVEIGPLPVQFLAHVVGKITEGEQVAGLVKRNALVETETPARQNLFGDALKLRIFYEECAWGHIAKFLFYRPESRIANSQRYSIKLTHSRAWSTRRRFLNWH